MKKHYLIGNAAFAGLALALAGSASAASYSFDGGPGGSGTDWSAGTNWGPDTPPQLPNIGGGDDFTVGPGFSPSQLGAQFEIGTGGGAGTAILNINNTTGTLTFGSGLFFGRDRDAQATQTSGTVHVLGLGIGMGVGGGGESSRYDMDGGSLNNANWTFMGENPETFTFDQTAGTVTLGDGSGGDHFRMSPYAEGGVSTYQISGGSLTINTGTDDIEIGYGAGLDGGEATFNVIGTGPSAITWNGNTTISGAGSQSGALAFTMGASGVTPIAINGNVNLLSNPDLVIDFGAFTGSGEILLINNDGVDAVSGEFDNAPEGTAFGAYTLTYLGGDGNDVVLLPEPSSLALVGLGLLPFLARRRR